MIEIRQLEPGDDVSAFRSGNDALDSWLKSHGKSNQHRYGVTYLARQDGVIVGYVAVSASSIARSKIGGGGPDTWPVLLLGRMAVLKDVQRGGIGKKLMTHVFTLAAQQYMTTGCAAVVVDSKPESVGYYTSQYGFKPTKVKAAPPATPQGEVPPAAPQEQPTPEQVQMYIAMKTILKAMSNE